MGRIIIHESAALKNNLGHYGSNVLAGCAGGGHSMHLLVHCVQESDDSRGADWSFLEENGFTANTIHDRDRP